jgi:hypothetical protein
MKKCETFWENHMAEETKTEVPKVTKPSPREIALESALKDAMAMIEDLTVRLQRMGIQVRGEEVGK